jgi:hypothetical protein
MTTAHETRIRLVSEAVVASYLHELSASRGLPRRLGSSDQGDRLKGGPDHVAAASRGRSALHLAPSARVV